MKTTVWAGRQGPQPWYQPVLPQHAADPWPPVIYVSKEPVGQALGGWDIHSGAALPVSLFTLPAKASPRAQRFPVKDQFDDLKKEDH